MIIDKPLIFDITKGSFIDGPGVRTVVFLKACPLRCLWCQNPESHESSEELFSFPEECIDCGNCQNGKPCYTGAKRVVGKHYPASELVKILLEDKAYYEISGGGVTFSGGEPAIFTDYLEGVLSELKKEGINIAIQTSGFFDFQLFESRLLPNIDIIYYDIKILDPIRHKEYTGKSNEIIIDNFIKLLDIDIELVPCIPLVPGYTATKENLTQIGDFLRSNNISRCELLSYNPSGIDKLVRLGKKVPDGIPEFPLSIEEEKKWHNIFKNL